jgi:3-deoxy-D-manno-octulosonate 8-phosphate phosphatase KdsC-like HAD superfamily phosphatase
LNIPETIEAAVAIIEALDARTAAYDVRIGELEQELLTVTELRADVARLAAEVGAANAATDVAYAIAEANQRDNANLRQSLANYMLSTDGGQAALREFKALALSASIAAQQAELAKMVG